MSIYGALYSGVSGLSAQAQALGMISDNISNVNTVGYKSTVARFQTLVTEAASTTTYAPGGVRSLPYPKIDQQGLLQSSSSPTDLAIIGDGFFVVHEGASAASGGTYFFTRAGGFKVDETGNLVTSSGHYLQGWRLDPLGNLPANTTLLTGLETVNVSALTGAANATSYIEMGVNLPAQDPIGGTRLNTVQLFDKQGVTQNLTLEWVKTASNTWALLGTLPGSGQFADTDTAAAILADASTQYFPNATLASTTNMTLTAAAGNVGGAVGAFTVPAPVALVDTITVNIGPDAYTATVPTDGGAGNDLIAGNTIAFTGPGGRSFTVTLAGAATYNLDGAIGQTALKTALDSAFSGISFSNGAIAGLPLATVTFNADGSLGAIAPTAPYGALDVNNRVQFYVDYDGNAATTSTQDRQLISLDIGTPGQVDGVTQFGGSFVTSRVTQDGLSFGNYVGMSVNDQGIVTAQFDNGQQRQIFKLPLAVFNNPNGLEAQTGNVYGQTNRSGTLSLQEAGAGAAGHVSPNSLESSTVDLAAEFTNMIITQRAYSANAKVISTADEMLDELIRIRR